MPENAKLRPQEEERLRALLRRSDALGFALSAALREEWGYPEAKARTVETLEAMLAEANERFESYKRELGIPDPLA
jgi:hypothetical protein